ncbi:MAG: flagellar motor switch protein FliN [Treponema sp.]|nr:flagellar motor switch protein FliN [Treponema sp.]
MSDGAISQDEIDALLSGVSIDGLNSSGHVGNTPSYNFDIPTLQKLADDLKPKLEENINKYTSATFTCDAPVVEKTNRDRVLSKLPEVVIGVNADYNQGIKGSHLYLLSSEFALKLFQLVSSEEAAEVDDMVLSVVSEFVATHISAEITQIDSVGKVPGLAYATPEGFNESKAMVMFPQGDFVVASYPLSLDGNSYTLWECLGGDSAEGISKALGGDSAATLTPVDLNASMGGGMDASAMGMGGMQQMGGAMPNMGMGQMGGMQQMGGMPNMGMPQMGGAMPNMGMGQMGGMQQMPMGMNMGMNVPNVQQLQYPNLTAGLSSNEQGNIGLIMDVNMEMTVELGRTKKSIKDILGMGEGTIIELDKLAGEPVDILVNHKPIAKGEVVVIDENFGVRVTEILSPIERVNELT